jgi:hypothetical protein
MRRNSRTRRPHTEATKRKISESLKQSRRDRDFTTDRNLRRLSVAAGIVQTGLFTADRLRRTNNRLGVDRARLFNQTAGTALPYLREGYTLAKRLTR